MKRKFGGTQAEPNRRNSWCSWRRKEIYYPGKPHGLTSRDQDEANADLLKFLKSVQMGRKAA
jgi:hypothetical protein